MKRFFEWLVVSSASPDKTAMTMKGVLVALIPLAVMGLRVFGFDVLPQDLETTVIDLTGLLAITLTGLGLVRKIYNTWFK